MVDFQTFNKLNKQISDLRLKMTNEKDTNKRLIFDYEIKILEYKIKILRLKN